MITPLPSVPLRSDGPATFADRADTFLAALPDFVTQANALETNVNAKEVSATNSAAAALASENAAVASAGVAKWVSGTTYTQGDVRWSPANFLSYRRKVGGAGATDPSADATNWAQLVTLPAQTGFSGKYLTTNGSAASWEDTPVIPATTQQIFTFTSLAGTYTRGAAQTGATANRVLNTVTIGKTAHGFVVGDWVYLDFAATITDGWFEVVTVADANTFTVTHGTSATTSTTATIYPPIVVTATAHGLTYGASVFVDWTSGGMTADGIFTVRKSATNTFQAISTGYTTTPVSTSGNLSLPQVGNTTQTWTRPVGCKAVEVELCGGGGGGTQISGIGNGAGYTRKLIDVSGISTETITLGYPGVAANLTHTSTTGGTSSFGSSCSATGGYSSTSGAGIGVGGDVNVRGTLGLSAVGGNFGSCSGTSILGSPAFIDSSGSLVNQQPSGYGAGGYASSSGAMAQPTPGVVIVKEYY